MTGAERQSAHAPECRPEESIRRSQLGPLHVALENSELVTESQDLELES